jgi:hypothetical protein
MELDDIAQRQALASAQRWFGDGVQVKEVGHRYVIVGEYRDGQMVPEESVSWRVLVLLPNGQEAAIGVNWKRSQPGQWFTFLA